MRRGHHLLLALATIGGGSPAQAADTRPAPFTVERLELSDGRVLHNVAIRSYDAPSGRVLLVADQMATTVPLAAVVSPPPAEIAARAPKSGATVVLVPETRPAPPPFRGAPTEAAEATVTPLPLEPAPAESTFATATAHREFALAHAARFYRFEFAAGSSAIRVTALDLDADATRPVPGWPGRYRTEGRAFLEFYDSYSRSFSRATSSFEVLTEQKPGEGLRVEVFRRKN